MWQNVSGKWYIFECWHDDESEYGEFFIGSAKTFREIYEAQEVSFLTTNVSYLFISLKIKCDIFDDLLRGLCDSFNFSVIWLGDVRIFW
jgi:hypothetical protein